MKGPILTEDDWICWEDGKVRMELVEEVQLFVLAANAVCEEQYITLQPRDFLWWIFKACACAGNGVDGSRTTHAEALWQAGLQLEI